MLAASIAMRRAKARPPIQLVASGKPGTFSNGSSFSVPAHPAGSLVLVFAGSQGPWTGIGAPAGWTRAAGYGDGDRSVAAFWRISDGTSFTAMFSGSGGSSLVYGGFLIFQNASRIGSVSGHWTVGTASSISVDPLPSMQPGGTSWVVAGSYTPGSSAPGYNSPLATDNNSWLGVGANLSAFGGSTFFTYSGANYDVICVVEVVN